MRQIQTRIVKMDHNVSISKITNVSLCMKTVMLGKQINVTCVNIYSVEDQYGETY